MLSYMAMVAIGEVGCDNTDIKCSDVDMWQRLNVNLVMIVTEDGLESCI